MIYINASASYNARMVKSNMLRRLGVKPLPPSGVIEWVRMVDLA
jgi:hypothetical protein